MTNAPLTVLVAEDDPKYRATIKRMIGQLGLICVDVEDGRIAAELLRDASVELHLAITDMRMPGGSGWRVVEAARAYRGASFPVIMQTGEAMYRDVYLRAEELSIPLIAKDDIRALLLPAVRSALGLDGLTRA